MKNITKNVIIAAIGISALQFDACKSGNKDKAVTDSIATDTLTQESGPVISTDEELAGKLKDATKDFPGVTATASAGEITLEGSITRDRLPALMQSVSALHAKKINNKLTISK
ncbi:hypothetical protein DU508_00130 [Pedobacter chinensis]|uniref:BON domain-containing protein n=1 Tax=Pedobacter chinensis TaxID=2282421 RepID=A0A369Q1W6_9SPHI|nr:hypothetical protein [Pedobacter chinensis]RDC58450.1 hypothetical protein DU508_00130 [Pedobacter chinensis]